MGRNPTPRARIGAFIIIAFDPIITSMSFLNSLDKKDSGTFFTFNYSDAS
jgi:hypothetical protein